MLRSEWLSNRFLDNTAHGGFLSVYEALCSVTTRVVAFTLHYPIRQGSKGKRVQLRVTHPKRPHSSAWWPWIPQTQPVGNSTYFLPTLSLLPPPPVPSSIFCPTSPHLCLASFPFIPPAPLDQLPATTKTLTIHWSPHGSVVLGLYVWDL